MPKFQSAIAALVALTMAAAAPLATGCATARDTVRAVQQYSREPANLTVALSRLNDLERTLTTVNALLTSRPYTPGDTWIDQLALDDDGADRIERELRGTAMYNDRDTRVPVATIYLSHVQSVLAQPASSSGTYPNVLAAIASLAFPGLEGDLAPMDQQRQMIAEQEASIESLRAQRRALSGNSDQRDSLDQQIRVARDGLRSQRDTLDALQDAWRQTVEQTDWQMISTERMQIGEDLLAVLSVAARLEAEAAALVPVIVTQLYRTFTDDALREAIALGMQIGTGGLTGIVAQTARIGALLSTQVDILSALVGGLVVALGTTLRDTPGYLLRDTAVESLANFAFDSFFFEATAGTDALFFHFTGTDDRAENQGDVSYDYTGRQREVRLSFAPIIVADASVDFGFDVAGIPEFLQVDLDYATDRVFSSGGSIETSDDIADELNISNTVSDVLAAALGIAGVKGRVSVAHFTSGEGQLVDSQTDAVIDTFPLQLQMTQIDIGYDFLWLLPTSPIRSYLDSWSAGFRVLDYAVPRIMYEFEDTNGDPDVDDYVYLRESPLQRVRNRLYMVGTNAISEFSLGSRSALAADLGFFFGGGPIDARFDDPDAIDIVGAFGFIVNGNLSFAAALLPARSRFQIDLVANYNLDLILSGPLSFENDADTDSDLGNRTITYGGADIVHGPNARLRISY